MSRGVGCPRAIVLALLVAAFSSGCIQALAEEVPAAQVATALRNLGPPGVLWGRLAVEEESPDGLWTPLNGVEVRVYPMAPDLLTGLERIRESARDSGSQYDTAVARLQAALHAYDTQVEAASRVMGSEHAAPPETARRRVTDPAGLFVFEDLPAGEWLLVAIRVTPYRPAPARVESQRRAPARGPRFLPKSGEPSRDAEVWLTRVRVDAAGRVGLSLTDRARWLAGPLR